MCIRDRTCCELKILPGIYQLVSGEVTTNDLKDVAVEDLLGRAPIPVSYTHLAFCALICSIFLLGCI